VALAQVDAVWVDWEDPDGLANLFTVELYDGGVMVAANATTSTSTVFYGLDVGVEYCARVRGGNGEGSSNWVPPGLFELFLG